MYWHLRSHEENPRRIAMEVRKLDMEYVEVDGERKTRFETMGEEAVKLTKMLQGWAQAPGKNFFMPNEKSLMFFLSVAMTKFISGGNRSGKTTTCAIDFVMQAEGWHPLQRKNLERLRKEAHSKYKYYSAYERRWIEIDLSWLKDYFEWVLDERRWIASPPVALRCVTVDFPNGVEKFCGPEVMRWATKSEIKDDQHANEKKRRITWKDKSFIEFMTTDQDLDAHGGTARHGLWYDEEPPSPYWMEGMMRTMSVKGRMLLGMTAVKGITWPKVEIWDKWEELTEGLVYDKS